MTDTKKMMPEEALEYSRIALWSTRGVEAFAVLTAMAEENAALKAEGERLEDKLAEVTKLWATAERDATHLYARTMKAEAELEKASPLLEAVNQARIYWNNLYTPISMSEFSKECVIAQAIEYAARERKVEGKK